MKILYLHQYFNTLSMAGGTRSFEMGRRLVSAGHEVHVITTWRAQSDHASWFETVEEGIHVHWLPNRYSNKMTYAQRIGAFFRFAWKASIKAKGIGGDVVFATSTPLTIAVPGMYASKRLSIPMVFEVRDLWPELPIAIGALRNPALKMVARYLERLAYRNSSAIIALSPGMKEGIVRLGVPQCKVTVIPNSADNCDYINSLPAGLRYREARPWLTDKPLLVYAGTFGKINGVGAIVDIAKELLHIAPNVRILLVGDGQEEQFIRSRAKKNGTLNVNLFMEGSVPKSQMPGLLAAATMASSFFVDLPEMRGNSANKFFDALAASTPVVINHGGWMADLLDASGAGIVIWRLEARESAERIAWHIDNAEWLASARVAAKKMATSMFDRDLLATKFEKVLQVAVDGYKCQKPTQNR